MHRPLHYSINFFFVVLTLSYNQPRFYLNATWNLNATTFITTNTTDDSPYDIFVNSKNSIYVSNRSIRQILIWQNDSSINPSKKISGNLLYPNAILSQ
mgnify:FL=1